jgi:hypothetical protein
VFSNEILILVFVGFGTNARKYSYEIFENESLVLNND